MEKYLRLLSPKTTNFDAIPSGGHGALTAADICIAISYARLNPIQENLFRLKCLGANTIANVEVLANILLSSFTESLSNSGLSIEYHFSVIKAALIEFCMVAGDYKPSNRNRAVLTGFSFETVRNLLSKHINEIKDYFFCQYKIAEDKIVHQIKKETL